MTGHYENFSRIDGSFELCFVKFTLDLDIVKTKIVSLSKKLSSVNTTSNDPEALARASGCGKLLPAFLLYSS